MTEADPLYNDWIHQQLRVQPDRPALHDLTADRLFSRGILMIELMLWLTGWSQWTLDPAIASPTLD